MKDMKKYAKMFDIPLRTAIHIKLRQIVSRMDNEDSLEYAMALCDLGDCLDELLLLEKRESLVHINNYRETVTEEMKQQALDYPIERLLEFNSRNQTLAWCHNDKNPSLHLNKSKNRCFCNPCGKVFNAIDVARHVYGLKYYDAIRFLCKQ